MVVVLLILIAFILLFGAGVVLGWLRNVVGFGIGGLILLILLLKLGSYFGEYGFLWVIGAVAALFGLAVAVEDRVLKPRLLAKLDPYDEARMADLIWNRYVDDIREHFSSEAQQKARTLFIAKDHVGLENLCKFELSRIRGN